MAFWAATADRFVAITRRRERVLNIGLSFVQCITNEVRWGGFEI